MSTAKGFLNQLEDFESLFLLNLYKDIFTITDIMYKRLQKVDLDVGWSKQVFVLKPMEKVWTNFQETALDLPKVFEQQPCEEDSLLSVQGSEEE